MIANRKTLWEIQPHTKIKHLILRRYLEAWLPIMAQRRRILFIDGFAGPGRYSRGEEGSPLIALRVLLEHPHFEQPRPRREVLFCFIERREDRAAALQQELQAFGENQPIPGWVNYKVIHGEFTNVMITKLDDLDEKGKRLPPTFAFIDPSGFKGVPMEVIARIVKNPRCECLITFMYEYINRFINSTDLIIHGHLDQLFATNDWRVFQEERDPAKRRHGITDLYRKQLIEYAGLKHVRTFEMINEGNRTEYFLYFGTNDRLGLSKMKEAMWRADPEHGQVFSDLTDLRQMVLLEPTSNIEPLKNLLLENFRGRGCVGIKEVSDFVLFDTPYSEAIHLKTLTLKPMEQESPPLINARGHEGRPRRAGTYPDGTLIEFL